MLSHGPIGRSGQQLPLLAEVVVPLDRDRAVATSGDHRTAYDPEEDTQLRLVNLQYDLAIVPTLTAVNRDDALAPATVDPLEDPPTVGRGEDDDH